MELTIIPTLVEWEESHPYLAFEYTGPAIRYNGDKIVRAQNPAVTGGGYKKVYRAMRFGISHITSCIWKETKTAENIQDVMRGCRLQTTLQHPNVTEIWSSSILGDRLVILQPDYGMGLDQINLSWPALHFVFMEIARGLVYLGEQGVVHGDLCQCNIFIGRKGVWIGDYDTARRLADDADTMEYDEDYSPGRFEIRAPEKMTRFPYGREIDIWALGIIGYSELSSHWALNDPGYETEQRRWDLRFFSNRYLPDFLQPLMQFRLTGMTWNKSWEEFVELLDWTFTFPDAYPRDETMRAIIRGCLQPLPKDRLTAAQVLQQLAQIEPSETPPPTPPELSPTIDRPAHVAITEMETNNGIGFRFIEASSGIPLPQLLSMIGWHQK